MVAYVAQLLNPHKYERKEKKCRGQTAQIRQGQPPRDGALHGRGVCPIPRHVRAVGRLCERLLFGSTFYQVTNEK